MLGGRQVTQFEGRGSRYVKKDEKWKTGNGITGFLWKNEFFIWSIRGGI
ncbi:hypothetical protein BN1095_1830001 [Clostridioides difficile]|uniref:Uncharacterized protein n=1 Tax=Clostridioides difficile TaxID=1496 RepID=A0A069ARM3_CLODI|nr:hypothetical protein BN1095_1830001 [Clostridioides difficile]